MKKYLIMCIGLLAGMLSFTSCGDDDKDIEDVIGDITKVTTDLKDKGDELILTVKQGSMYTSVYDAKFKADKCTSYILTTTYKTEEMAKKAYEDLLKYANDSDNITYSIKGKVVTSDMTPLFAGWSKELVKTTLESMAENMKKMI